MDKIPVYFMPGLAASSLIFENISLPEDVFECVFLEWEIPLKNEPLLVYTERMAKKIKHENPVLIGVSFGGILVQELAKFVDARKVIIISSIKSNQELPDIMKVAKTTKIYKLVPTGFLLNIENLRVLSFIKRIKERLPLYRKYLSFRNKHYLDWSIAQVVLWDRTQPDENVIHIHGEQDEIFPMKYIRDCIVVKGGTHIMILNRFKWLNENLPKLILE